MNKSKFSEKKQEVQEGRKLKNKMSFMKSLCFDKSTNKKLRLRKQGKFDYQKNG